MLIQGCSGLPSKSNPEVFSTKQQLLSDGTLGYVFCTEGDGAWACPPTSIKTSFSDVSKSLNPDSEDVSPKDLSQNASHLEVGDHLAAQDIVDQGYELIGSVLFAFDTYALSSKSKVTLIDSMELIKDQKILLVGYTDAVGGESYNQELAVSRAKSVASFLEDLGFPHGDYEAKGRGSCCYISSNDKEADRALNRRVEIYKK